MVGSCEACVRNLRSISSKPTVSVFSQTGVFAKGSAKEHPCLAHVLKHPTAACPRSVIHAGHTCPQFCGTGRSWMLNKLCLELVPQKEVQGREIWRTRWSKLDCAVQHCLAVITSSLQACDGALSRSNKHLHQGSMRAAQLGVDSGHSKRFFDLLVTHAGGRHLFNGHEILCRSHHPLCENAHKHVGFQTNVAVVHGLGVMSQ